MTIEEFNALKVGDRLELTSEKKICIVISVNSIDDKFFGFIREVIVKELNDLTSFCRYLYYDSRFYNLDRFRAMSLSEVTK